MGQVVTLDVKFKMRIVHRIKNFCITATLKTGGAYYTPVHIIYETLRYLIFYKYTYSYKLQTD